MIISPLKYTTMIADNEKNRSLSSGARGKDSEKDQGKYVPSEGTEESTSDGPITDNPSPREPASPVKPDRHKEQ